jgi:hypothetical protein
MAGGEVSTFVMPAALLKAPEGSAWAAGLNFRPHQCCVDIAMHSFVEVRDMTGDGKVCIPFYWCSPVQMVIASVNA